MTSKSKYKKQYRDDNEMQERKKKTEVSLLISRKKNLVVFESNFSRKCRNVQKYGFEEMQKFTSLQIKQA